MSILAKLLILALFIWIWYDFKHTPITPDNEEDITDDYHDNPGGIMHSPKQNNKHLLSTKDREN